ncbi:oligosaccharide flippase family protein [Paraburkholderia sp. RP-4-7]|jgi:O-antigen/teichoic acid export membrane protein|uniref:Oligosaccharide flippase family protein n=1 Tax=Paraburkholderia polaris TaxID=2728848 RepID=A0A848IMQ4_9BURK|nr:oligosaccharide flippase family protein [Paraburkholderia polaris]NMM02196.1 oligosaccharide flippase family protein [Paraburkholderia polaris]
MKRTENTRVLVFVYAGYIMRYIYLIVVIPFYGRVLGLTEYGRVLAAMSLMNVIWMLVSYGFTVVGMRDVSKAHVRSEYNAIFSLHVSARVLMGLLGGIVGIVATFCSPVLSERPTIGILATVLGIVSGFNLGWLFQGRHRFRTPIILEVVGFAMSLVLVLSIVRSPVDSSWVLGSLLIAGVTTSMIAYGLTIFDIGLPRIRLTGVSHLIRSSTMLFCYSTGSVILMSFSTYLLTLLSTPTQVGYFGAAERFATIGLSLMGPAAQVFVPTISRQLAQGDYDGARSTTRRGGALLIGYGLLALCGALVLSPLLLPLILGEAFAPSAPVLQCFAWMFPFAAFNQFISFYVFVPLEKDRSLALAGVTSGLANLAAALYLGPRHGAMGMALARVISEATLSMMLLGLAARFGLLTGFGRESARAFAKLCFACGVGVGARNTDDES